MYLRKNAIYFEGVCRVTIEHIKAFRQLVQSASLQKAARELNLTTAALTRLVKSMEDELSVQLVARSTSSVILTSAGERLYAYSGELEEMYSELRQEMRHFARFKTQPFSIQSMFFMQYYGLTDVISSYLQENPNFSITINERHLEEILGSLDRVEADIGFGYLEILPKDKYIADALYEDRFCVMLNHDHPCAGRKTLRLSEVPHTTAILMSRDKQLNRIVSDEYAAQTGGGDANILDSNMRILTIKQYIKFLPDYISIVPRRMAAALKDPEVVSVPLEDFPRLTLAMIRRKAPYSAPAEQFMNYIKEQFIDNGVKLYGER